MDFGAHFRCCDLQVHSPRDLNWIGECPQTDEERRAFAREFVAACRSKGLSAVAITDHHDVGFVSYIREAAAAELDSNSEALRPLDRLVVFPGIELTLSVPCQALLIFDTDVSHDDLRTALTALGITTSPTTSPKTNPTERLGINLDDIQRRLSEHASLGRRFILLPNVNAGGDDTILRTGFAGHYKEMNCVGGYVDGSFEGHGRKQILDGKDPQWGNKRVGVIQTSDSRERDFSRLGSNPTWIKWSAPSSEALRQAVLAPSSRIRYSVPLLPGSWISRIEVSDSRYFGPFSVDFNLQLNTIIGGRGSGKSTILEYLRWALCDQAYVHHEDDGTELPDYEKRRRHLVSATLKPSLGAVTVDYIRNGVLHRIRREAATGKVHLKVAEQQEQETTEEIIQSLVQIQGYSQKQLSNVSVRTEELTRLLTAPISQELSNTDAEINNEASNLRQAFDRVEAQRSIETQLQAIDLDLASKNEQVKALSTEVSDLPEEQRKEIEAHPFYVAGERLSVVYRESVDSASSAITHGKSTIEGLSQDLQELGTAQPSTDLAIARRAIVEAFSQAVAQLDVVARIIESLRTEISAPFERASQAIADHRRRYDAAASENHVVQDRLESLRTLSDQIAAAQRDRDSLAARLEQIGDAAGELDSARLRWIGAITRKISAMDAQANRLSTDSAGSLRVRIEKFQDLEPLKAALQLAISGAGITRPEKFDALFQQLRGEVSPLIGWLQLGNELIALARAGALLSVGAELPSTPKFTSAGFTAAELRRIASRINPNSAFQLTLVSPRSLPSFDYMTNDGTYVAFQDASPGQQATALIGLLLNQSAGPLVVDQPEDDLDNSTILEVAERLSKAKERRQIIFSTHNPNIVVVGDSELVLQCAYRTPITGARVAIADQGAIDNPLICKIITKVMEGGEAAFRLRKERYGF